MLKVFAAILLMGNSFYPQAAQSYYKWGYVKLANKILTASDKNDSQTGPSMVNGFTSY